MSIGENTHTMPSTVLRNEHKVIKRVLAVLDRLMKRSDAGQDFETDALGRCVEFFTLFADACHHCKEEDLLFPLLESRGILREGGPIGVMLYEHTVARDLTKQMAAALTRVESGDAAGEQTFRQAALEYINLLTNHIDKEDNVLFAMGDRCMTEEDHSTLCDKFGEAGSQDFGGKKCDELLRIADQLEQQWP